MTKGFLIRKAQRTDQTLLEDTGHGGEEGYFGRCFDEQDTGKREIYIALNGDVLCGYVLLNWIPRYTVFARQGIPEIQDLYVVPQFRRQGFGRALIGHCENQARLRDCTHMGIGVGLHGGFGAAQRLYIGLGYVPDGNGITSDREPVLKNQKVAVDDDLSLMMVKQV